MRKRLLVGLLGFALIAAATFPFAKSGAQDGGQIETPSKGVMETGRGGDMGASGARLQRALPDFDIRLADKGEFTDSDVSVAESAPSPGVRGKGIAQARASAVEKFRASRAD